MSEYVVRRARRNRDRGLTLPELLITISLLGIVATVLSSAVIVSLRQQDNTEGRLNVARDEQAIGFVMPSDLASASDWSTAPQATPCGATVCDGIDLSNGSNVILLSWTTEDNGVITETNVSYHFAPSGDGVTYQLSRVECNRVDGGAWSCSTRVVMRDLPGPPGAAAFVPGVLNGDLCDSTVVCSEPTWVIEVSQPLAPDAIEEDDFASDEERKDANRVVVSIDGGGDSAGAGGGLNQVNITAGGTIRDQIDASSTSGTPAFVAARSRCGGPITLVVDDSGSIGNTAMGQVRTGVRTFVETLAGTPTQIQVVRFDTQAGTLGVTDGWQRYFDMRDATEVTALLAEINSTNLKSNGNTNWEDALYRTFYNQDGTYADTFPDTVVFFTDGVPTRSRLDFRSSGLPLPAVPAPPGPNWAESNGGDYNQTSFNRANYIARDVESLTNLIGVAVGPNIGGNGDTDSEWVIDPGGTIIRRYYAYERTETTYYGQFQIRDGGWRYVDKATYEAWDERRRYRKESGGWQTIAPGNDSNHDEVELGRREITQEQYDDANTTSTDDADDGLEFEVEVFQISESDYNANSSDPDYRPVPKTYIENGPDSEVWTGDVIPGDPSFEVDGTDGRNVITKLNKEIVAQLIAASDDGIPGIPDGAGGYTNVDIANMYVLPDWDDFPNTMQEIALGECGGTLTISTEFNGSPAPDPFKYVANKYFDSNGDQLTIDGDLEFVQTTQQFTTGTFDLSIADGSFLTMEIAVSQEGVGNYRSDGWSCRAGVADRSFELVDDPDSDWDLLRVDVAANEAVSCTQTVTR
ncbi:MAG: VWA domain-containing protein [Actinomycetota bacterium]